MLLCQQWGSFANKIQATPQTKQFVLQKKKKNICF